MTSTRTTADSNGKPKTDLHRNLTSGQIGMIALSGALGTGLFLGSGATVALAGPATILSYALAGLLALGVVWAVAEMVTTHPLPGGHGTVTASYVGKLGGFLGRWNLTVTACVAMGAEVTASATYLQRWLPWLDRGTGTVLCALFIIILNLAAVNFYGFSEYWFSMIKVVAITVFILLGVVMITVGLPGKEATGVHNLVDYGGFAPYGVVGILAATCMATFSFGGIEHVSVTAAESGNPTKDFPRAAHTMIWRLLIFYIGAISVIVMIQPWTVTAEPIHDISHSPFVKALDAAHVPYAGDIMNAVLLVAALSAANGCLYAASRMIHSLGESGMAPRFAAHTSHNGAPRNAVALASIGMLIACVLAIVSPESAFAYLFGCATVGILTTWTIIMVSHLAFRRRRKELGLPEAMPKLWGTPYTNIAVILGCFGIMCGLWWLLPVAWYAGVPYIAILFISYAILHRFGHMDTPKDLAMEEKLALESATADTVDEGQATDTVAKGQATDTVAKGQATDTVAKGQ
ncbi:amino acid permease [Actinotignum urinale]|uniref:amino acid permease n=1 Tax=Actinotignum urinale TaxID=190146 RepID=UPI002A82E035|nr:amino acid permease [Actinotignum urinale]MDY5151647.1 amino acid permease [Actinotignum urinale]